MRRRRAMPALISTIALIAGCGSDGRVEVSGVVRDRATGRAIAGARVVATDGSATRTDAAGRFTLSMTRGRRAGLRASALDHADVTETVDVGDGAATRLDLGLPSVEDERAETGALDEHDPDSVLRFVEESWVDDAVRWTRAHETSIAAGDDDAGERRELLRVRAAITLLGGTASVPRGRSSAHAALTCGGCHGDGRRTERALRDGTESDLDTRACAGCHAGALLGAISRREDRDGDGVAGTVAAEVASARARARSALDAAIRRAGIERCGRRAAGLSRIERADGDALAVLLDDEAGALGDCDDDGFIDGSEVAVTIEVLGADLAAAASDLFVLDDDASHGVHDAAYAITIARAIESTASLH